MHQSDFSLRQNTYPHTHTHTHTHPPQSHTHRHTRTNHKLTHTHPHTHTYTHSSTFSYSLLAQVPCHITALEALQVIQSFGQPFCGISIGTATVGECIRAPTGKLLQTAKFRVRVRKHICQAGITMVTTPQQKQIHQHHTFEATGMFRPPTHRSVPPTHCVCWCMYGVCVCVCMCICGLLCVSTHAIMSKV